MRNLNSIRLATIGDRDKIMSFIKTNWMDNHILANDVKFFDYQYIYKDTLQFVLAENSNAELIGILGYFQYNPNNNEQDIFLTFLKVIPKQSDDLISIKLIQHLSNNIKHRNIHCVGININTKGIYKLLRYQIGQLDHYVAFNHDLTDFVLCNPPSSLKKKKYENKFRIEKNDNADAILNKLKNSEFYSKKNPFKSLDFLVHRYIDHPFFSYIFYEVFDKDLFIGFAVLREVIHKKSQAIRIIDVIADDKNISFIINELTNILENSDYEYIDVYASYLNSEILLSGSFEKVSNEKNIIVPDYFSPFVKKNVDIYFTSSNISKMTFFKGDGDQDQPRIIVSE